ncbi:MAG: sulfur carrier protein ThiS [Actinomycetota bacterium]|nr:sulfur carrier protein ThiS [Actinomycetota bacterium]
MKVTVNGKIMELEEGTHLPALVERLVDNPKGLAVAVDGSVVPRSEWQSVMLGEGMNVEVVRAVQGGS